MYKHKQLPSQSRPPINTAKVLRMHRERVASAQLRHDMIQANKRQNYLNEYDRINGILSHNIAHGHVSHEHLTNRKNRIKELFDESFENKKHELYNN